MAITLESLEGYLKKIELNYERKENAIVLPYSGDNERILVAIELGNEGQWLRIRTIKHLDNLVAEATQEKRHALMQWMLYKNYQTKSGTWEYDPTDHDHQFTVEHWVLDNDLTLAQFALMMKIVLDTVEDIAEMKKVLGLEVAVDPVEKKRQELLAQLRALEESSSGSGSTGI